jgi:hypothetical protein
MSLFMGKQKRKSASQRWLEGKGGEPTRLVNGLINMILLLFFRLTRALPSPHLPND